jgi:cupin fold WbuC family metalloprotein
MISMDTMSAADSIQNPYEYVRGLFIDDELRNRLSALPFSTTKTSRLCLHESDQSPLHVMLVESAFHVFPRHCHLDSDEVIVLDDGGLVVSLWSDGELSPPVVCELSSTTCRVAFVPRGTLHSIRSVTPTSRYLEVKLGPFLKEACVFR